MNEREAFEAYITKDRGDLSTFGSGQNLHYRNSAVNNAWEGWQARAALAQPTASPAPVQADAGGPVAMEWLMIAPDGKRFSGSTPFKAANRANRHRLTTDQVAAQEFGETLQSIAKENEAENERLLAEHGTLNCPACGGSGHVGDVEHLKGQKNIAPPQPPAPLGEARKPTGDEDIRTALDEAKVPELGGVSDEYDFQVWRAAERFHGITGDTRE